MEGPACSWASEEREMATEGPLGRKNIVDKVTEVGKDRWLQDLSGSYKVYKGAVGLERGGQNGPDIPRSSHITSNSNFAGATGSGFETMGFGMACRSILSELC